MAAELRYDELMDVMPRSFLQRDNRPSQSPGLPETLAGIMERVNALRSDLRGTYETVTQLDVRITGHQVPPTAEDKTAPRVVRDGFIDRVNDVLNEIQGLTSGIDARLRNLTEKVGS